MKYSPKLGRRPSLRPSEIARSEFSCRDQLHPIETSLDRQGYELVRGKQAQPRLWAVSPGGDGVLEQPPALFVELDE
jgi:hypothetical protein